MRILVVDDATNIRILLARMLRKWGHDVVTARDGAEAWDILCEEPIPLVISDWMMPKMDGLELCARVREANLPKYVYFMLLTSRNETDDLVTGMASGADDFVAKPFDWHELKARLRAAGRVLSLQDQLAERNERLEEAYRKLRADLDTASSIQRALLPQDDTVINGVTFSSLFLPSAFVAGDTFDYFPVGEDFIGFYHLDVAGHGVSSALLSVTLSRVLHPEFDSGVHAADSATSPDRVVRALNERFQASDHAMQYFTMVYGLLHYPTRVLKYCQAGHPSPIVLPARGEPRLIGDGGFPVGLLPGVSFETNEVELNAGDKVILYSDGITECVAENREQYGEGRLMKLLHASRDAGMGVAMSRLEQALAAWKGQREFDDDVSLLALQC